MAFHFAYFISLFSCKTLGYRTQSDPILAALISIAEVLLSFTMRLEFMVNTVKAHGDRVWSYDSFVVRCLGSDISSTVRGS